MLIVLHILVILLFFLSHLTLLMLFYQNAEKMRTETKDKDTKNDRNSERRRGGKTAGPTARH